MSVGEDDENVVVEVVNHNDVMVVDYIVAVVDHNRIVVGVYYHAVLVVGPGLGRSDHAHRVMTSILDKAHSNRQALGVLDVDALRYLAQHQQTVTNWVITPHEAEAADLFAISAADVSADRVAAAVALHQKYQAVVVLKGAGTIVAHQAGVNFCHAGSPAMATPGMGDCLAGITAALIAQGLSAVDAAITGVNWHASLGYQLAQSQRVVLASDICQQLKLTPYQAI